MQWHGSWTVDVSEVGEGSRHIRPNQAGEVQVCWHSVEGWEVVVLGGIVMVVVPDGSRQPNQPGLRHEVVVVNVGAGVGVGPVVVASVVVVGSLHPNHPGVLQVEVEVVEVSEVVVDIIDVVVVSSRQPHHPGVWHVEVLDLVGDVVVDVVIVVVPPGSVPLLSKNFQRAQSTHSFSATQSGTSSYSSITVEITVRILWFPMPTLQPLSSTVS